jgi:hypothetical protein
VRLNTYEHLYNPPTQCGNLPIQCGTVLQFFSLKSLMLSLGPTLCKKLSLILCGWIKKMFMNAKFYIDSSLGEIVFYN